MNGQDKDPFERLSHIAAPEPDPAKIEAVAAMSARAFSAEFGQSSAPASRAGRFGDWLKRTNWLMPASAMAFTVLAAVLVVPLIGQPDFSDPASSETMVSRERTEMADAPAPIGIEQAAPQQGVRMGAAPAAPAQGLPLDMRSDVETSTYTFEGIDIMVRSAPDEIGLYLLDGTIERPLDTRMKEPSETFVLADAFQYRDDGAEPDVLLVRSGIEGGAQQWDAFVPGPGGAYALSGELSGLVGDAADRAEVIARIEDR